MIIFKIFVIIGWFGVYFNFIDFYYILEFKIFVIFRDYFYYMYDNLCSCLPLGSGQEGSS